MIQFDEYFQMDWFNRQLDLLSNTWSYFFGNDSSANTGPTTKQIMKHTTTDVLFAFKHLEHIRLLQHPPKECLQAC